jgi:exodeoxyribonuclease (lambda-induced)
MGITKKRKVGINPLTGEVTAEAMEPANPACTWGVNNEANGIVSYMSKTGNYVQSTGLHSHPHYNWLAGSPDGFVGEEGLIEVKCPYYYKRNGASRIHEKVPGHYWLLEITGRQWCDHVCWTPEGMAVYRVHRDSETFDYLLSFYSAIYASIQALSPTPPPLSKEERATIAARIEAAMDTGVDLLHWKAHIQTAPPASEDSDSTDDANQMASNKRQRLSTVAGSEEGEVCDTANADSSKAICSIDRYSPFKAAAEALLALRDTQVPLQAATGEVRATEATTVTAEC